jgi:hypothetical protein
MFNRIRDWFLASALKLNGLAVLSAPASVDVFQPDGTPMEDIRAEVNTTWDYSVIDETLARELNLLGEDAVVEELAIPELGAKKRPLIMVSFNLGGRSKRSRWVVMARENQAFPVAIGRHDLAGFLIQTSENV